MILQITKEHEDLKNNSNYSEANCLRGFALAKICGN
jgi:hypothetical protein